MDWQTRRKLLYALIIIVITGAISVFYFKDILFPSPTCDDAKKNGYEVDVDCGGICALRCQSEVEPLVVLWSKAIKSSPTTYDLVAMVSNKNINNSAHEVTYIFSIYNSNGGIIQELKGATITPIDGDFPIVKQSIVLKQIPYNVTMRITDAPHYKVNEKPTSPTLRIGEERYEPGTIPRVYAMVKNTKRMTVSNVPVRVVLYDQNGNVYAAGETVIPKLEKEEIKEISFTWDGPLSSTPTRIRVYTIFDPFLAVE